MKVRTAVKIAIDILMTITLLSLMAYSLIGEAVHEWIGAGMFFLLLIHNLLNFKWSKAVFKRKLSLYCFFQTALVVFVFLTMLGSMISGIVLSNYVFDFLSIRGGQSWARSIHMLSAYWGLVLISLHLGFHWNMMMGMAQGLVKRSSAISKWILRCIATLISGYGFYAFVKRDIGNYMLLKNHFVFFDFEESILFYLMDYAAVMGAFVCLGHYVTSGIKMLNRLLIQKIMSK